MPKKTNTKIAEVPMSGSIKTRSVGIAANKIDVLRSFMYIFLLSIFEKFLAINIIKKSFAISEG